MCGWKTVGVPLVRSLNTFAVAVRNQSKSPPLQAWMMMIFGLSISAGQFSVSKCLKIWSISNTSGDSFVWLTPTIFPRNPWDMTTSTTLSVSLSFGLFEKWDKASFICCGDTKQKLLNPKSKLPLHRFLYARFYLCCEVCVLHHLISQTFEEFFHVLFILFSTMSGRFVIGKFNVCNQQSHPVRHGLFVRRINLMKEKFDNNVFFLNI